MKDNLELCIYQATCHADGIGEGPLIFDKTSKHAKERYLGAMEKVLEYLSRLWGVSFSGINSVLPSEKEALEFKSYAEKNIEGAIGKILLYEVFHGKIIFQRRVVFEGWNLGRIDELATLLTESGFPKVYPFDEYSWKKFLMLDSGMELPNWM